MYRHSSSVASASVAVALAALLCPAPQNLRGQERSIVSSQIEVSASTASLSLEFSDGSRFSVAFADGAVTADDQVLGSYQPGGAADRAWRDLLAEVLPLSGSRLAQEFLSWSPELGEAESDVMVRVDRVLDLAVAGTQIERQAGHVPPPLAKLLKILATDGRFGEFGAAVESVDFESMEIVADEGRVVGADEALDGSVLVAGSELELHGRVEGHAIVVDGVLVLEEGGRVEGDVRLVDGRVEDRGGSFRGDLVDVLSASRATRSVDMDQVRHEMLEEARREVQRDRARSRNGFWSGRRPVAGALASVFQAAATFFVLALATLLLARVAGARIDAVTEAVGHSPARSAAVGFAGSFLMLPVYVLGIVLLAVSIVGIPLLLAWAPLFPLAVLVAGLVGCMSVGHHVGRWALRQDLRWPSRADHRNPIHAKLAGLAVLLAPFPVAGVLKALPVIGWTGNIVQALGVLGGLAAVVTGLGAVIITRGGRYPADHYAFADTLDDLDAQPDWPEEDDPPSDASAKAEP